MSSNVIMIYIIHIPASLRNNNILCQHFSDRQCFETDDKKMADNNQGEINNHKYKYYRYNKYGSWKDNLEHWKASNEREAHTSTL